jgi:mycoredoxin
VSLDAPSVTFYWRPGCPFCVTLRTRLSAAGIAFTPVNIWDDPDAAAAVRAANRGNELVPTVRVGDTWLSNPGLAAVQAVLDSGG